MIEANYDEVICPNCVTQFRAIPVNVQHQITALTTERDAYAKAADDMAASHKVERDELNAQISDALGQISHLDKEVAGWIADQKENLKNQCELFGQLQQALVERDALRDAAKLALNEMENVTYAVLSGAITVDVLRFERTVSALKAVL